MKIIRNIVFCITILSLHDVNAGSYVSTIDTLSTRLDGRVVIYLENDHTCDSNTIYFDETAPGFPRIYAALLTYQAQGKRVRFQYSCDEDIAILYAIENVD